MIAHVCFMFSPFLMFLPCVWIPRAVFRYLYSRLRTLVYDRQFSFSSLSCMTAVARPQTLTPSQSRHEACRVFTDQTHNVCAKR